MLRYKESGECITPLGGSAADESFNAKPGTAAAYAAAYLTAIGAAQGDDDGATFTPCFRGKV